MSQTTEEIVEFLEGWVEKHSSPDEPYYEDLTPRELLKEVKEQTKIGKEFIQVFQLLDALMDD